MNALNINADIQTETIKADNAAPSATDKTNGAGVVGAHS